MPAFRGSHGAARRGMTAEEFAAAITKFGGDVFSAADQTAKQAFAEVCENIISGGAYAPGTPVDTGLARDSWGAMSQSAGSTMPPWTNPERRKEGGVTVVSTPPRDNTGAAAREAALQTILATDQLEEVTLGTQCPYMEALEYGHSGQAPAGMIRITVAHWEEMLAARWLPLLRGSVRRRGRAV